MKTSQLKMIIREVVREEIRLGLQEIIGDMKQVEQNVTKPIKRKVNETKSFSKNSVINDILNETAMDEDYRTMGGGTYDSSKINDIMGKSYGDMMGGNNENISVAGQSPDFLKKDYRAVMKAIDEKNKRK